MLESIYANPDVCRVGVSYCDKKDFDTNCYFVCSQGQRLVVDSGAASTKGMAAVRDALAWFAVQGFEFSVFLTIHSAAAVLKYVLHFWFR